MIEMLREFHSFHGFSSDIDIQSQQEENIQLLAVQQATKSLALLMLHYALIHQRQGDERLYRAHLVLEEASEVFEALINRDEVELADSLSDLMYVTVGTAETYGLPIDELFKEVHRSNMTKKRRTVDNARLRDKGDNYSPPQIEKILKEAKCQQETT